MFMQNGQTVSHSSRALTTSERKYFEIEKELLAQASGVERNRQCVYGRKVVQCSDHIPLETISKKPLARAPERLQRLVLRLRTIQQYYVETHYESGPELYLVDTMSRAYLPTTVRYPAEEETERISMQLIPYPFRNPSWLRSSVKLQQTQYYSSLFK